MDSPFSNVSPFAPPKELLTLMTQSECLVKRFGIAHHENELDEFIQEPSNRDILLYCQILKLREDIHEHKEAIVACNSNITELWAYSSGNWVLSKAQEDLLAGLLGHWLIKPLKTYEKIYLRVQKFVHLRAQWLHLGVYVTDPLVRQTIDRFLQDTIGKMKDIFRKKIVAGLKDKKLPLEEFARGMLQKYHAPIVPGTLPQETMAALALLHSIVGREGTAASTGEREKRYWPAVEAELARLYRENSEDRKNEAWLRWERDVIRKDNQKYDSGARLADSAEPSNPMALNGSELSAHEADEQAGLPQIILQFNVYHCSALPVNIPPEAMNSDVSIDQLGDVASTLNRATE